MTTRRYSPVGIDVYRPPEFLWHFSLRERFRWFWYANGLISYITFDSVFYSLVNLRKLDFFSNQCFSLFNAQMCFMYNINPSLFQYCLDNDSDST